MNIESVCLVSIPTPPPLCGLNLPSPSNRFKIGASEMLTISGLRFIFQVFTFEGFPESKLLQRTLYLQVLDYDRFSRNDSIGEVELPLCDIHLQEVKLFSI